MQLPYGASRHASNPRTPDQRAIDYGVGALGVARDVWRRAAMNNGAKKSETAKRRSTEISCVPGRDGTGINTRRRKFTMPWKSNICRRGACAATDGCPAIPSIIRSSAIASSASSKLSNSKAPDPNPNSAAPRQRPREFRCAEERVQFVTLSGPDPIEAIEPSEAKVRG